MCGIVGIVNNDLDRPCDRSTLVEMRDVMIHRGPDDEGLIIDSNVGLAHRRLSIIDLSGGHQPMTNEDGSLWIVYNGEIYNFQVIREELIKKGHVFKTKSDTEVILHLYEEKGPDCVKDLNGMFAFAIWNKKDRSLFLARDRMGIKPLYYAETKTAFLFSSEIKSLIKFDHLLCQCNDEAVFEYFLFRHVSGEKTLFKGVKSLLPAHTLLFRNRETKIRKYWSPFPTEPHNGLSFACAAEELSFLIKDAVKIRLMSDVPLGTFCSGGLDSSLVTAIAAQLVEHPINTFSVGFYETDYDETYYARMVSKQCETIHHETKLTNEEFSDLLPEMIWHNDEPLNFANSVQIYAISKLAKKHVTVVLTGEGSDELFAGYPRYYIPKLAVKYQKLPLFIKKLLDNSTYFFDDHRLRKLKEYSRYSSNDMLLYNSSVLSKDFLLNVLSKRFFETLSFRRQSIAKGNSLGLDPITNLTILDQQNYLVSILHRQDRMSMAPSIESRVPFLDYRIVEFANKLPIRYKMKHFQTKLILKRCARSYLPDEVITRKKSGFGVPLSKWLRESEGLGKLANLLYNDSTLPYYLEKKRLSEVISEHKKGLHDHSELLWTVINFQMWRQVFAV